MRTTRLAQPAFGLGLSSLSPRAAPALEAAGLDFVAFDAQHSTHDEGTVAALLGQLRGSSLGLAARVSDNVPALIGKVLDAGADTVVVPMVGSATEAARAVAATRYGPSGQRSLGPFGPDLPRDPAALEARVRCLVMVETAKGLSAVDEICAVDGIAGVVMGPADLALSLGLHPSESLLAGGLDEALAAVRTACERRALLFGAYAADLETARHLVERGATWVVLGTDTGLVRRALTSELRALAERWES